MDKGTPGERLIDWTGERCVPWADDVQMIYEHYHRYLYAMDFVAGLRVLDLASGEGFGCALLAERAMSVVGLELDEATVSHARSRYAGSRVSFELGSVTDSDALVEHEAFDVITCFEAIEHVSEQDRVVRLAKSRLKPGGVFLCSTPDKSSYVDDHGNDNPFHVRELREPEFNELLTSVFDHVSMLRQTVAVGSLIHDGSTGGPADTHTLQRQGEEAWYAERGAPHTYLLGVASSAPIEFSRTSVLVDPKLTLVAMAGEGTPEQQREFAKQLSEMRAGRANAEDAASRLRTELEHARCREREMLEEHQQMTQRLRALRAAYTTACRDLDRSRRKGKHDDARLNWVVAQNTELRQRVQEIETEYNHLRAEYSVVAQRVIGRYRSAVEQLAPRGTRRRDVYESAFGRPTGTPPAQTGEAGPVSLTTAENPIVSVVIPTYGNWTYTRACLLSISENPPSTPFEVVVVDDASVDDSADRVAQCSGVRLARSAHNLGYVGACNSGANAARGSLLMFLNNDTEVRPGWLDALVELVNEDTEVGLAGAQLRYPDGRLQECGSMVWADGTGWNYGRNEHPDDPRYWPVRDVDYCSGAALLVRRDLFNKVGGFDRRFSPAYYEDADLAFAVRAAGYRTVVHPGSVVVHHEGATNGTDLQSGVKRNQEVNRAVFVDKWSAALRQHYSTASARNLWSARQRTRGGHHGGTVLVADHQVPRPDEDSGSVRMASLLELLIELDQRVVFFAMNHAAPERYTDRLQRLGITVLADPARQGQFLSEAGADLRFALLSRPQVAWQLLEQIRQYAPACRVAYDTVDLHFLRLGRQADLAASLGNAEEEVISRNRAAVLREMELGLIRTTDATLTVSEVERELLAELVPEANVRVLSNVHHMSGSSPTARGRSDVLFVGSFAHQPNTDAALWLATTIMPAVWRQQPDTKLHIVGSNPVREILDLADDRIVVHGWVADLDAFYRDARVVAAPLRFGAGVKGKVGESLCRGVPVVGTQVAVEAMNLEHGKDVLIADKADEFADHIVSVLLDDDHWQQLSDAGAGTIVQHFGRDSAKHTLLELLAQSTSGNAG